MHLYWLKQLHIYCSLEPYRVVIKDAKHIEHYQENRCNLTLVFQNWFSVHIEFKPIHLCKMHTVGTCVNVQWRAVTLCPLLLTCLLIRTLYVKVADMIQAAIADCSFVFLKRKRKSSEKYKTSQRSASKGAKDGTPSCAAFLILCHAVLYIFLSCTSYPRWTFENCCKKKNSLTKWK